MKTYFNEFCKYFNPLLSFNSLFVQYTGTVVKIPFFTSEFQLITGLFSRECAERLRCFIIFYDHATFTAFKLKQILFATIMKRTVSPDALLIASVNQIHEQ